MDWDYTGTLRTLWYGHHLDNKSHIAIRHIAEKLRPPELEEAIKNIARRREDVDLDKKDFGVFTSEATKKAGKVQQVLGIAPKKEKREFSDVEEGHRKLVASSHKSRHAKHFPAGPKVASTVTPDVTDRSTQTVKKERSDDRQQP